MKSMRRIYSWPRVLAAKEKNKSSWDQRRSRGRNNNNRSRWAKKKLMWMCSKIAQEHLVSKIEVNLIQMHTYLHQVNIHNVKLLISQSWRAECWSERLRVHTLAAIAYLLSTKTKLVWRQPCRSCRRNSCRYQETGKRKLNKIEKGYSNRL